MARIIDSERVNIIGENLRKFRREQKMSQQTLSEKLETFAVYVCRGSIARIEGGTRTVTDIELLGFSKVLNKPVESFFDDNK